MATTRTLTMKSRATQEAQADYWVQLHYQFEDLEGWKAETAEYRTAYAAEWQRLTDRDR